MILIRMNSYFINTETRRIEEKWKLRGAGEKDNAWSLLWIISIVEAAEAVGRETSAHLDGHSTL